MVARRSPLQMFSKLSALGVRALPLRLQTSAPISLQRWESTAANYLKTSVVPRAMHAHGARVISSHIELWGEGMSDDYKGYKVDRQKALEKRLNDVNRFQKISEREDRCDIPLEGIIAQCQGRSFIHHRGCQLLKSSDDIILFQELLWNVRPATVVELGTFSGGSALWMADMLRLMEIKAKVFSMDITHSNLEDRVLELKPANLTFLEGDSYKLEKTFPGDMLHNLPHPWLIVEDAHENILGVMEYFHPHMKTGDYFVIEDLSPYIPRRLGFGAVYKEECKPAGPEVLNDLKKFLTEYSQEYAVDSFYTDFFGYNGTWNMHGYIRRM